MNQFNKETETTDEKSAVDTLKEKIFHEIPEGSRVMSAEEIALADAYCEDYRRWLDIAKTEREAVSSAIKMAEKHGFVPFDRGAKVTAGDKVYLNNRGKALILAVVGSRPIEQGVSIAAAHIDSPRLDLKPNPLYEDTGLAYFDTHYYGGIKKYQWSALPLALHGVVMLRDGTKIEICIGEQPGDPVFCVTDLLPHLASEQMKRPATEIIRGEDLNILVGCRAFREDGIDKAKGSDLVKLSVMNYLHNQYGMVEGDFLSAELEAVPVFNARDVGFDRGMVGAYGQDDRVCAYPALTALFSAGTPEFTAITVLADKEEIGSEGNTGMKSAFLPYFVADLAEALGQKGRHVLSQSVCLSADVNVAFDPIYPDVLERRNCAYLGHGVVLTKYTGARGKSDTSDASAELMHRMRTIMDDNGILWQIGELGRVDAGGGGTVAKYIAGLDVETVDLGVPVLSMHSPFEITSKLDVHMAHRAFSALFARK